MRREDCLRSAVDTLTEYGVPAVIEECASDPNSGGGRPDGVLGLQIGEQRVRYETQCKSGLQPGALGSLARRLQSGGERHLLIADYVTPGVAARLRELEIPYVDLAGNAWLEHPPVVIRVEGHKGQTASAQRTRARPFTPAGLKVVFALLCNPKLLDTSVRHIASASGAAHGTAASVVQGLRDGGYVIERKKGSWSDRRTRNLTGLLDSWSETYARNLAPKLVLGRYAAPSDLPSDWWRDVSWHKHESAVLSGEPAAALLTDYLEPGSITIYADRLPARVIAQMRLEPDAAGPIEFRERFWPSVYADMPDLAPPVLVYADLLATDNPRCLEVAPMIYDKYIARHLG